MARKHPWSGWPPLLGWVGVWVLLATDCGKRGGGESQGGGQAAERVQAVETCAVAQMDLKETVGLIGTVAATESAELRPEIPGVVESIQFKSE